MTVRDNPFDLGSKRTLAELVVDRIRELIAEGELIPGDKLPSEVELSERMGVSRTALREGMRTLKAQGVLTTKPGVGTVVRAVGAEQLVQPLTLLAEASQGLISFDEFHRVRVILETEIAALAAAQATEEGIAVVERALEDMAAAVDDVAAFAAADATFHHALGAMTGNPLLELLMGAIRVLLEEHIRDVVAFIDPARDVLPFHEAILRAVQRRDADDARTAMQAHLEQVRINFEEATRSRVAD